MFSKGIAGSSLIVGLFLVCTSLCPAVEKQGNPDREVILSKLSKVGHKEVGNMLREGIGLKELKEKLGVRCRESSRPDFVRFYLNDGVLDVPRNLRGNEKVARYRLGVVRK